MITKGKIVSIIYTMYDPYRNILDTNEGYAPLTYLHGYGNIDSALESALTDMDELDSKEFLIDPLKIKSDRNKNNSAISPIADRSGPLVQLTKLTSDKDDVLTIESQLNTAYSCMIRVVSVRDAKAEELERGFPWMEHPICCGENGCC